MGLIASVDNPEESEHRKAASPDGDQRAENPQSTDKIKL